MCSKGATLLEFLVSVTLISIASAAAFSCIHSLQGIRTSLRSYAHRVHVEVRTASLLSLLATDGDTHRLPSPFRLHKAGKITFSDLTPHPYFASRPLQGDVVTGYALSMRDSFSVRATSGGTTACRQNFSSTPLSSFRNFLVLSTDGESEMTGTAKDIGKSCALFSLTSGKSVSFPQNASPPYAVIIPITRHYSYGVDEGKTLRYIAHAGEEIIEYQPIVDNASPLLLTIADLPVPILTYHSKLEFPPRHFSTLLQRLSPFDTLVTLYVP